MSVKVEVVLRNTYDDGRVEDHIMHKTQLVNRSDMIKVAHSLVMVADMVAQVSLEELLGIKADNE